MGLDMYLEAKLHLPPYNKELAPVRHAIGQAIGYTPPTEKPDNDCVHRIECITGPVDDDQLAGQYDQLRVHVDRREPTHCCH